MADISKPAPAYDISRELGETFTIEQLWDYWKASVEDFQTIDDSSASGAIEEISLEEKLDIISRAQRKLVDALIDTPSLTFQDCVTKLKLWRSIIVPEGAELDEASPTDQLGVQAVDELIKLMGK